MDARLTSCCSPSTGHRLRFAIYTLLCLVVLSPGSARADPGIEFFEKKIRPVLVDHCYSCHSAEAAQKKKLRGGLYLDSRAGIRKGGDSGPAVVPGKAKDSLILKALRGQNDLSMPPKGLLPENVAADFERWIQMGAPDPREGATKKNVAKIDVDAGRAHWAFAPLKQPKEPGVKNSAWVRTPIDAFLLARMEAAGLAPAADADPRTLLRRVYLDLIGLPPSPEEQAAFLKDPSPKGFERVVDDLLSRRQYGERWARHWLDVVRYAETHGYERDEVKQFAWRYRDYVIQSLNDDMPYDQFVREQLAGDELPSADARTQIASTYLRLAPYDGIAANRQVAQLDFLDDTLGTTSVAFMGLTIQCARCHDHKFEPISQEDYYRVMNVFAPLNTNTTAAEIGNDREKAEVAKGLPAWEAEFAKIGGGFDALRADILARADVASGKLKMTAKDRDDYVAVLRTLPAKRSKKQEELFSLQGSRRLEETLKQIATADEKKELARMEVDVKALLARKPQILQGYAAGESGSNGPFKSSGKKGELPSIHLLIRGEYNKIGAPVALGVPTILGDGPKSLPPPAGKSSGRRLWFAEWLTREARPLLARVMVNRVWQYHFGRGLMANANEFGLSAGSPSHPELLEWLAHDFEAGGMRLKSLHRKIVLSSAYRLSSRHTNPEADLGAALYSRWEPRRLEAEAIRDSLLAVSGRLNLEMGGPSISPPFDASDIIVGASSGLGWQKSDESQASRRSVYVFAKRAIPLPEFRLLGMADPSVSTAKRVVATTAVQALVMFNGRLVHEQAGALAKRLVADVGDQPEDQVRRLVELALCREATAEERQILVRFLTKHPRAGQRDAGGVPVALQSLCLVILNTNEFVYMN